MDKYPTQYILMLSYGLESATSESDECGAVYLGQVKLYALKFFLLYLKVFVHTQVQGVSVGCDYVITMMYQLHLIIASETKSER